WISPDLPRCVPLRWSMSDLASFPPAKCNALTRSQAKRLAFALWPALPTRRWSLRRKPGGLWIRAVAGWRKREVGYWGRQKARVNFLVPSIGLGTVGG